MLRARYLLQLTGFDPQIETNTAMPPEFLMAQLELREAVAEAREAGDEEALDGLHEQLRSDMAIQHDALRVALDETHDKPRAGEIVRQLMFQENLLSDIDAAL